MTISVGTSSPRSTDSTVSSRSAGLFREQIVSEVAGRLDIVEVRLDRSGTVFIMSSYFEFP